MIYVIQFFDSLLLAQLYLLPGRDTVGIGAFIKRRLFSTPHKFSRVDQIHFKAGETLYTEYDESDDIYYILSGTVTISCNNTLDYYTKGTFFGEIAYLLESPRTETVQVTTDVTLLQIKSSFFEEVRLQNPELNQRVIETVSDYIRRCGSKKNTSAE
jgi:membrane protein